MNVLVIDGAPVVALDIAEALRGLVAEVDVMIASTESEAESLLAEVDELAAAIVGLPLSKFGASALPDLISARGGKVVVSAPDSDEDTGEFLDHSWTYLPRPFTDATFRAALVSAGVWTPPSQPPTPTETPA